MGPLSDAEFAARLDPLGPFEPSPTLAVAVSGGADSLALALLAHGWAGARGGTVLVLIVDHGLRAASAYEAAVTASRLDDKGIRCRILRLRLGACSAAAARDARLGALEDTAATAGIPHVLLAHHAGDQAETVAMRRLRGSGPWGLAGMAALVETARVRLLRPLLDIPPVRLRQTLLAAGLGWVDDPSNLDLRHERARLRALRCDRDGIGPLTRSAVEAARARGCRRAAEETEIAAWLGRHVALLPGRVAEVDAETVPPGALAAIIASVGGRARLPSPRQIERWTAAPGPATLGRVAIRRGRAWSFRPEEGPGDWAVPRPGPTARALTPGVFVPFPGSDFLHGCGGDAQGRGTPHLADWE